MQAIFIYGKDKLCEYLIQFPNAMEMLKTLASGEKFQKKSFTQKPYIPKKVSLKNPIFPKNEIFIPEQELIENVQSNEMLEENLPINEPYESYIPENLPINEPYESYIPEKNSHLNNELIENVQSTIFLRKSTNQ